MGGFIYLKRQLKQQVLLCLLSGLCVFLTIPQHELGKTASRISVPNSTSFSQENYAVILLPFQPNENKRIATRNTKRIYQILVFPNSVVDVGWHPLSGMLLQCLIPKSYQILFDTDSLYTPFKQGTRQSFQLLDIPPPSL